MDKRLVPLNGLIALLSNSDDKWPKFLRDQGWHRHQFEVKIASSLGNLRADGVIFRLAPNVILLCEAKSGRNIDEGSISSPRWMSCGASARSRRR